MTGYTIGHIQSINLIIRGDKYMKLHNRVASMAMALTLSISLCAPAFATNVEVADGTGSVPVELTTEAATFSVTVPTSLPITVKADGSIVTATDAKIVNNSHGAVLVSNMTIAGTNDWAIDNFDTMDPASMKVGTKKLGMEINGDKTTGADAISFTQANFPVLAGKNDTNTDELPIVYNAKVPAQATVVSGQNVASVVFTVGWNVETPDAG